MTSAEDTIIDFLKHFINSHETEFYFTKEIYKRLNEAFEGAPLPEGNYKIDFTVQKIGDRFTFTSSPLGGIFLGVFSKTLLDLITSHMEPELRKRMTDEISRTAKEEIRPMREELEKHFKNLSWLDKWFEKQSRTYDGEKS